MCDPKGPSVVAAGLTVVLAYEVVDSLEAEILLSIGAAIVVSVAILVRVMGWHPVAALVRVARPVRSHYRERVTARAALSAPLKAIEGGRVVHLITGATRERISG